MKTVRNKPNLFLSLIAMLGAFLIPVSKGTAVWPVLLGLLLWGAVQWVFNTAPIGPVRDKMADDREKLLTKSMNTPFWAMATSRGMPITLAPGPTQNIRVDEHKKLIPFAWFAVFFTYWGIIIRTEDALGYTGPIRTAQYRPFFLVMAVLIVIDVVLYVRRMKKFREEVGKL